MNDASSIIEIDRDGDILIVTPAIDLGELNYGQFEEETKTVCQQLENEELRHLVIDLRKCEYFGSSTINLFVRFWKMTKKHGGQIVLCGLSSVEREALRLANLETLWPICSSRDEALETIRKGAMGGPA
jgi:anti-anti-sigma factor